MVKAIGIVKYQAHLLTQVCWQYVFNKLSTCDYDRYLIPGKIIYNYEKSYKDKREYRDEKCFVDGEISFKLVWLLNV